MSTSGVFILLGIDTLFRRGGLEADEVEVYFRVRDRESCICT